ncbi:MAG: Hsp20/alpha crystallin family protein [Polyangiaceae bacterium]|nr:Hsp20/alpha crystallin family protein [Polyangiaceae bacterium]
MQPQTINGRQSTTFQGNGAAAKTSERETTRQARTVTPPIDVLENANEWLVFADLPGVSADSLNLSLEKDTLTLTAERKSDIVDRSVVYKRAFFIPNEIDPDKIEAKLEDGVLTLRLPRRDSMKPRTIAVKAG